MKSNNFFMKGHLLHNIHNGDNKNESKNHTKAESQFTTNPRGE